MADPKVVNAAEMLYSRKEYQTAQYIRQHGLDVEAVMAVLVAAVGEYGASWYRKDLDRAMAAQ